MTSLGIQYLMDFRGCNRDLISSANFLRETLIRVAKEAGATVVTDVFHSFNPYGVSGVVVIAESHVAIHTWPEHGFVSIDVFSCTEKLNSLFIRDELKAAFKAEAVEFKSVVRGELEHLRRLPETSALSGIA